MRTSGEIDFRFRLKLKITLVESTYPSQRPECPSLSSHFLLLSCMNEKNLKKSKIAVRGIQRNGSDSNQRPSDSRKRMDIFWENTLI